MAPKLIKKLDLKDTEILCEDKGYDTEPLREQIENTGTQANILNTLSNHDHMGWCLYKLKQSYENCVALACIFIWLPL